MGEPGGARDFEVTGTLLLPSHLCSKKIFLDCVALFCIHLKDGLRSC